LKQPLGIKRPRLEELKAAVKGKEIFISHLKEMLRKKDNKLRVMTRATGESHANGHYHITFIS
jgi:hypothetical protein